MNICMTSIELEAVPVDFARTLERELTETERLRFGADADRRRLRAEVERLTANQRQPAEEIFVSNLSAELTAAKAECDLHRNRLASILWSGTIDKQLCGDVQKWADDYTAELTRLRAEVERWNDIINRASVQFFHDGSDGETAAKMLTVLNEAKP
jgi:hypothetical protein